MKRPIRISLVASLVAACALSTTSPPVHAVAIDDGIPGQSSLDSSQNSQSQGNWSDLAGGVTGRPYIASLSVTTNGTTTQIVTNGTASTPAPTESGAITAVISPTNLCKTGSTNNCYATPNRVGITLAYVKQAGQLGHNFSAPTATPPATINATSVFDMTIGLNTVGKKLGWTWMNGTPTFWKTENLGQDNGTARVKFSLSDAPGVDYQDPNAQKCTTIPVSVCDAEKSTQDTLGMQMVLSLDTTLSAAFAGALFATNAAVIGSLDVSGGETPSLTYGIAAPHKLSDGTVRKGKFYGILSDAVLESQFKIATTETDMTKLLSVARTAESKSTADAGTDTVTWTKWNATDNGTDGRLVTISDISFSAPKFKVTKVGSSSSSSTMSTGGSVLKAPTGLKFTTKARTITLTGSGVAGITYKATATSGATTKSGSCKLAGTKLTCTVKATKAGSWKVKITPSKSGASGTAWSRSVSVK
ncbi:MAG: hypothetical protein WCG49_03325 [Actinomycetes bacterium]